MSKFLQKLSSIFALASQASPKHSAPHWLNLQPTGPWIQFQPARSANDDVNSKFYH